MSRIFVDDIVIDEASGNAIFTVYLDIPDVNTITVRYQLTSETTTPDDYPPKATTLLTFLPGETSKLVTIPINNDLIAEFKESFRLFLSAPINATFAEDNFAFATIIDNDAQAGVPVVSINDFVVDEANKEAIFFITLDKPSNSAVTMNFQTQDGTALAGSDFVAKNGSLSFAPGETAKMVKVSLLNDIDPENAEAFNLVLSNITNATAPDPVGTAVIAGNDTPSVAMSNILVDDIIVDESQAFAEFLVRLDAPNTNTVTVRYQEAVGTAGNGNGGVNRDFNSLELVTLTFAPGEVVKSVRIPIVNDSVEETVESFRLFLSAQSANATISDRSATATIIDNDASIGTPAASITDAVVDEANQTVTVSVILNKPSASNVSFNVTGQGITAVEGSDFQNTPFGKIAFAPGEMVKTVTFGLLNDNATENAELFDVVLSNPVGATIADGRAHVVIAANDAAQAALPVINVANVEATENKGYIDFLVTLSAPGINTVKVNYFTDNGTATSLSNSDFVAGGTGALTFAPGEMVKTVRVTLTDDNIAEALENFTLNLTGAINATIGNAVATATIIDNDNAVLPVPTDIIGTSRNDILKGTQQNDTMIGADGDDVFDGGAGNDSYDGGAGNDIYIIEQTGDTYTEALNSGTDTVVSYLSTHTLGLNVENLILAGTAVTGIGNGLDNTITGNASANTINGGLGNDILNGGAGSDTVSYSTATAGVTVSLALAGSQNTVNAGFDTLSGFENLIGSNFNDTLTGNNAANIIIGGLGNDNLNGGGGTDTVSYSTATAAVTVNLGLLVQQNTVNAGLDILSNFESLIGGNFNDTLTGNAGANVINGGTGADNMTGDNGNDTYVVDNSGDTVAEGLNFGTDTVQSSVTYSLAANVENLALTGALAINGTGNGLNNVITGNSAANTLNGGLGNDTLLGKAGNDSLTGGAGTDTFVFDTALSAATNNDTITDFIVVDDTIRLENAIFTKFTTPGVLAAANFVSGAGAVALDNNDFLIYDTADGSLYYDADGNGAGAKIEFVSLTGIPALSAADFIVS